ncbi:unnamed protein product [Aureobasidium pullulans]|nr:unnamed protein product [Aureobasidium pullulans]
MPGCNWLTVPGNDLESALYAVAAGLASRADMKRPLDWSKGTPERKIFDYLKRQYGLIVNDELRIGGYNNFGMLAEPTKPTDCTVVVRQVGRRWEVLAHFTDPNPTKIIIDELQKHSSTMLLLLAALKLAAVAEDKDTTT